ncbi:hypothetical protein RDI58_018175 [Solanum bulbocastanum]|uniref:Aminotransferase-like plant mobile domain-containing protein n=1 Tax=Solanum bulbocastanum TaxID=147425 RepID=A0AAN8Y9I2_SOLBU
MQYDHALITTMVEHWRSETHCFHLLFSKGTITLQDLQCESGEDTQHYWRDQFRVDSVGDATLVERVEKIYSQTLHACYIGGILFSNTSGNLISLQYMTFLDPIQDVGKYSWGSAVLAYLYRALCWASIVEAVDICGFILLLLSYLLTMCS